MHENVRAHRHTLLILKIALFCVCLVLDLALVCVLVQFTDFNNNISVYVPTLALSSLCSEYIFKEHFFVCF